MSTLAPWFYRNLLESNQILESPVFFKAEILTGEVLFEATCSLKNNIRPEWASVSEVYSNKDGSGTSKLKNVAVYKAISEALERWAFYGAADSHEKEYCFDVNPTTTGMAAMPGLTAKGARVNAIMEANERWAINAFWRGTLPIKEISVPIDNLRHFVVTHPFENCHISLLSYKNNNQYLYAFAAETSLDSSVQHALIELARNIRVMSKIAGLSKEVNDFKNISDKRLFYFSTQEGYQFFCDKIKAAPIVIKAKPKLICDSEIKGEWSKYTKVWRYLYDNSYPDSEEDHTFFMF